MGLLYEAVEHHEHLLVKTTKQQTRDPLAREIGSDFPKTTLRPRTSGMPIGHPAESLLVYEEALDTLGHAIEFVAPEDASYAAILLNDNASAVDAPWRSGFRHRWSKRACESGRLRRKGGR